MAANFWLVGLPVCLVLGFVLGMKALGIWIGLAIALLVAALMLCVRFYRLTRFSQQHSSSASVLV